MANAFKCDACGSFSSKIPWHIKTSKPYHIVETKEFEVCDNCMLAILAVLTNPEARKEKQQ